MYSMLESNLDDLVTGEISANWSILATLANDIGFVGLLPVHAQSVFIAEDGNGLEGKFVCGTEDSNGDFTSVGDEDLLQLHDCRICPQAIVHRVLEVALAFIRVVDHDGRRR